MSEFSEKARLSNLRASLNNIDPPRPGRKTYGQRYQETSHMTTAEIRASIREREAGDKECGVLYQVLADRGY